MPNFSIITPVLNQATTIEACIESVATQQVDVEHIIIDGGSTDGTLEIIRKHESKLTYWIREKDNGQSHAINKGLQRANGTWFNWLNADDQLTKNALQTVLRVASSKSQVVVGKCQHINQDNEVIDEGSAKIWDSLEATLGNYSMGQPSVFYRTDIVRDLAGLNKDLHLCLDMDLWFRFLLKYGQENIITTNEVLSRFLVHQASKSSARAAEMTREKYGVYKALLLNFELPVIVKEFLSDYHLNVNLQYAIPNGFDQKTFLGHFCWHLLVAAYNEKDYNKCNSLYYLVKNSSRLSNSERLIWEARLASAKVFNL